jgi:1,4-alpha-glucan branching enzyme
LNNHPFSLGYTIENSRLEHGHWQEIFNSDAQIYGGENLGNLSTAITSSNGRIHVVIPANGFVVLLHSH